MKYNGFQSASALCGAEIISITYHAASENARGKRSKRQGAMVALRAAQAAGPANDRDTDRHGHGVAGTAIPTTTMYIARGQAAARKIFRVPI